MSSVVPSFFAGFLCLSSEKSDCFATVSHERGRLEKGLLEVVI